MVGAVAGHPGPAWFAGLMSPLANVPGLGWIAERLGQFTTTLSLWWSDFSHAVKLSGLVAYACLVAMLGRHATSGLWRCLL